MRQLYLLIHSILKTIKKLLICFNKGFPFGIVLFCDINLADLPTTTKIYHPFGIIIRSGTKIGSHCIIRQGVTIGQKNGEQTNATIKNNVSIGANAVILGAVTIGNNTTICAGALVLKDVPDNTTIVGLWN